ncbi:MAG: histidine phosphatase family protein [Niastella sp.]|uniref:histidine phosphatase family protein n=1 Tax=Niastella sp. TaxID=1869183 RepID=UPI00389AC975
MNNLFKSLLAITIITLTCNDSFAQKQNTGVQRVVIIRHGEKPDIGDNLSCKGFNRSLQLPAVLYAKYKVPDKIFVPSMNNGKSASHVRMFETISPFAIKYNIGINTKYDVDEVKEMATAILKTNGYALVVWEHDKIDNLVKALGADAKGMKWSGDDFDSIWIITFKNGQAMVSTDKENINPANDCR